MHRIAPAIVAGLLGLPTGALLALSLDRLYPAAERPLRSRVDGGQARRWRIALLSVSTALLWALSSWRSTSTRHFLLMAIFGTALLLLSATDFERHLLPNRIMYPSLVLAIALSLTWPGRPVISGLLGGLAGAAIMLLIFLVLPGFGFGDVKLAALIGLMLGFPGILYGLLTGMVLGGVGAGWMLVTRRVRLRSSIAYGPYLAGGAILVMLFRSG
jgi:prepilin signal peptidase PulO-like enzyme (type II secretory pathway)